MAYIFFFPISLLASIIGSICGVGGGVFMKPTLDALGILPVNTITFLSSCTVMSMAMYNVISSATSKENNVSNDHINWALTTWLAIGSAIGGIIGKILYSNIKSLSPNPELVGGYQAIILFISILFTLAYTVNRKKIKGMQLKNPSTLISLGFLLGAISSFAGIGGGPINLAVLYFFLSMSTKLAVTNSLYIILISQTASMIMTFVSNSVPQEILAFDIKLWIMMIGMIICGICGGILGKRVNKKLSSQNIDKLFNILCVVIMGLCVFNALSKFNII